MGASVMSTDNQSAQSALTWRCFHCDEEFTDAALAEQHFGHSEHQRPACQINVAEYRAMEERMQRYNEEDSDLHRHIHRIESEHQKALMREEEAGYAKGLADGRSALAQAPAPSGETLTYWVRHYGYHGEEHDCWGAWEECDEETYRSALGKAGIETRVLAATPPTPEQAGPSGELCMCKDRPLSQCPGEWEPGCDLGANEKFVSVGQQSVPSDKYEQARPSGERSLRSIERHMHRAIDGALRSCIKAHGPITDALIPSAVKRIRGQLAALASPGAMEGAQAAQPEPNLWQRVEILRCLSGVHCGLMSADEAIACIHALYAHPPTGEPT